jgi:glycosyltransferase involved in cell wall biosynthesis
MYRRANLVVAVSEVSACYIRDELGRRFTRRLPTIDVIPNAFVMSGGGVRRTGSAVDPARAVRLVSAHSLVPLKNTQLAVRAMTHLPDRFQLVCLGDGPERDQLDELVTQLGLTGRVSLLGFVEDVGPHLVSANLFVHPSKAETFCLAVFEAASERLPVVCLSVGSLIATVPRLVVGVRVKADADPMEFAAAVMDATSLIGDASAFDEAEQLRRRELALDGSSAVTIERWCELVEDVVRSAAAA